jgi:hypothetical protein
MRPDARAPNVRGERSPDKGVPDPTNQRGNASLEQAIRRAPLSDAHWEYAYYSNRIEVVISATDLPEWEDIMRKWQQSNSAQMDHPLSNTDK